MVTGKYSASFMNVTEGHEAWMMTITQERPCLDRRFIKMLIRAAVPRLWRMGSTARMQYASCAETESISDRLLLSLFRSVRLFFCV